MSKLWETMRARGWMVVDDQTRRLAIQPTYTATLVLVCQRAGDHAPMEVVLAKDELPQFIGKLQHAHELLESHAEEQLAIKSVDAADDLIERVKAGLG